jgi:hypothetical protein
MTPSMARRYGRVSAWYTAARKPSLRGSVAGHGSLSPRRSFDRSAPNLNRQALAMGGCVGHMSRRAVRGRRGREAEGGGLLMRAGPFSLVLSCADLYQHFNDLAESA